MATQHTGVSIVRPSISHDIWASHPDSQASHRNWNRCLTWNSGTYNHYVLFADSTVSTYTWNLGLHVLEVLVNANRWSLPIEEMYNVNAVIQRNDAYWRGIALRQASIEADMLVPSIAQAMESQFSQEPQYRCRHCGYVDADRHMFNGAMNCIYCQQDRLAPTIVPDSEWDSYNPGLLASEPDIYGYED